ncbi:MAG: hypothetical protein K2X82_10775 [Gemmataceae bacterium]|nr:hypothetical protein [Gemmataceae bacterium]
MKATPLVLTGLAVLMLCDPAAACGRRKKARPAAGCVPPAAPPVCAQPGYLTATQAVLVPGTAGDSVPAAAAVALTPTAGVEPRYAYNPEPGAYYYTYDENGKLIVRRWMDWVFRGGREAGMPRPPLPVVGWFTGR